jgi:hypothetical protein
MIRKTGIRGAIRKNWFFWLCLLFLVSISDPSLADEVVIRSHSLRIEGDSLRVGVELDSLFSKRALDAIESGMITSVIYDFRVNGPRNARIFEHSVILRLEHDIWEGQYLAIRQSGIPDTLRTTQFAVAATYLTRIQNIVLGELSDQSQDMVLQMRTAVNPISVEQEQRTRNWLNVLQKGSLLELFISLDRPSDRTKWVDVARFNPGELR